MSRSMAQIPRPRQIRSGSTLDRVEPARIAPRRHAEPARLRRTNLNVGHAEDPAEREADRVADDVLVRLRADSADRAPAATGQPSDVVRTARPDQADGFRPRTSSPDTSLEAGTVGRSGSLVAAGPVVGREGGPLPDTVAERIDAARAGGAPLPGRIRTRMESAFAADLSDVRVHHGAEAAHLARTVSAQAFTTGRDIFFGAGQYRPDSPGGERLLAHELAHTRQNGAVRRSTIRRWNIDAPTIDLNNASTIKTIETGQLVWMFEDQSGDTLVIKREPQPIGLAEMSGLMHEQISNVKSVRHRKLTSAHTDTVDTIINGDHPSPKLDRPSWSKLGEVQRKDRYFMLALRAKHGTKYDVMDDFNLGRFVHKTDWGLIEGAKDLVAMTHARGETARELGRTTGVDNRTGQAGRGLEKSRLRRLMTDLEHVRALGRLTAVDLFLGNKDRVFSGNLGNWVYTDANSAAMTAIDHVDKPGAAGFHQSRQTEEDIKDQLQDITRGALRATAKKSIQAIAFTGASSKSGDDGFVAWLDEQDREPAPVAAPGRKGKPKQGAGLRRRLAEEAFLDGLVIGRTLLIKTFSATKFSGSSTDRKVKKAIKKSSRAALVTDGDGPDGTKRADYYRVLKARAEYLRKN